MVDRKTKVIIEAEPKGFEKAKREIKGTFQELDAKGQARSAKVLNYEIGEMARQFRGVRNSLKGLNKDLRMKDGAKGVADMRKEVERLSRELDKMRSKAGGKGGGGGGGTGIRGGFGTGLMTGMGLGEVFPEQGLRANVAGRFAGRGVRGAGRMAGGFGSGAFSGAQGFAQGLSGIPVVGGFLAGQMQSVLGLAGQGMQSLQARRGLLPMMGGAGLSQDLAGARAGAIKRNPVARIDQGAVRQAGQGTGAFEAEVSAQLASDMQARFGGLSTSMRPVAEQAHQKQMEADVRTRLEPHRERVEAMRTPTRAELAAGATPGSAGVAMADELKRQQGLVGASKSRQKDAIRAAENATGGKLFAPIEEMAGKMGIMPGQALQMAGQIAGATGGRLKQFGDDGGKSFLRQAFGAQTSLGLNAQTTGAFSAQARLGNIKGGTAGAESSMLEAIRQGMKMGLDGSELQRYMQQTAAAMTSFEQTGMPLDPSSIGQMGNTMARMGLGGVRGSVVGQGMVKAGQRLSQTGPQSAGDLLMFKTMYGFKGEGLGDYAATQRRAAKGEITPGGVNKFIDALLQGSADADEGQLRLLAQFQKMGLDIGAPEAYRMAGGDRSRTQEINTQLIAAAKRARAPMDPAAIAEATAPGGMVTAAGLARKKEGIGRGAALGVAHAFESSQLGVTAEVARLAPQMNNAAKALGDMAKTTMKGAVDIVLRIDKLLTKAEALPWNGAP